MKFTAEAVPRPAKTVRCSVHSQDKVSATPRRRSDQFEALMPGRATLESKAVRFRILY